MSQAGWARWRAAEEERGAGVEAAARTLPARQGWILRALAALEAGDRAALESLARAAPGEEFLALAELALSEPGAIDPTRFRARLKQNEVRNEPLPRLDLLRLACAAHNGDRPTRPQKLATHARHRPALEAALMVLSPLFKPYKIEALVRERSPRMASFWAAGIGQHLTRGGVRDFVRKQVEGVEPLPEEGWPGLEEPLRARGKGAAPVSLAEFLRDPLGRPWGEACAHQVRVLSTRGERAQRLQALGGLLDAIDVLIRESAPIAAVPVVQAALRLAEASPEVRQRQVFRDQLQWLDLRLRWATRELPDALLEPVWRGLEGLPVEARAHGARAILERARGPLPQAVAAEVLALALHGCASWRETVMPHILEHGDRLHLRAFQAALRDVPAPVGEVALGYLHALHGSTVEACRLAARLFERGAGADALPLALSALGREVANPTRGRQERRLRYRARLELARALAASPSPPAAELLVGLLVCSAAGDAEPQAREVLELVLPVAHERLALPPEPGQRDLVARLQLLSLLGLHDRAREAFRDLGRWLRGAPQDAGIDASLRVCAGLCTDEGLVLGFDREDSGAQETGPAGADDRDPRPGWLRSLTAWLDRQPTGTVARRAVALARSGEIPAGHLHLWFEEVSGLEPDPTWDDLGALVLAEADDEDSLARLLDLLDEVPS